MILLKVKMNKAQTSLKQTAKSSFAKISPEKHYNSDVMLLYITIRFGKTSFVIFSTMVQNCNDSFIDKNEQSSGLNLKQIARSSFAKISSEKH